jgi:lambda family phage portal protein
MKILDFFRRKPEKRSKSFFRNYVGAAGGRLFSDFVATNQSQDSALQYSLPKLRNRSRDLERNNEYARKYLNLLQTNVIGDQGFNLQVKARTTNGTLDGPGNTMIENAWARWSRVGNCTVDGKMSFLDCQRLAMRMLARDGEVFVQLLNGNPYRDGFAIKMLEADWVDDQKNETLQNGNQIRMGIEINEAGQTVAYWVLSQHPGDTNFRQLGQSKKHVRVPADRMMHVYMPNRISNRGEPWMAAVIDSLKMLRGYREAELVAARVAASKMGVITTPSGDEYTGDATENSHTPLMNADPGTFHQLPAGWDIKMFDPTHPTTAFADFEKAVLRGIASGLNVAYTSLSNDLEATSYSSIRAGTLEDRDNYRVLQQFMIEHFVDPIFRQWLASAMLNQSFPLPPTRFDKFADAASWRGRGWNWVDPLKEINAAVIGLNNGILSMQDVAAQYGRDVEETFSAIQRDKELANSYGLQMAFEPFGTKMPAPVVVDDGNTE